MAELFQAPDLLSLIFSPQEYPEKGGVTGFAEGFMGGFGAGMGGGGAGLASMAGGAGGAAAAGAAAKPAMSTMNWGTVGASSSGGGGFMSNFLQGVGSGGGGVGQAGRAPTDNPSRALSGGGAYSRGPTPITPAPSIIGGEADYMLGGLPNINRLFDSIQRQIG